MIGSGELIAILCLALLLFGGKRLPEIARSLGLGIREFKKACSETEEPSTLPAPQVEKSEEKQNSDSN